MASLANIAGRLPSLYRPEPADASLVANWLRAVAAVVDALRLEAHDVLQSHWFQYADRALYSPFFLRCRAVAGQPPPKPDDPALALFPYLHDLARLGALFPVAPWEQPPQLRDVVEDYRLRVARVVSIYRNGLGTMPTLRRMVEAQLPRNHDGGPERSDRPFWIEEFAAAKAGVAAIAARGVPLDMVGPLMRWTVDHDGLTPASLTVYIQGVTPKDGSVDATLRPEIELYQAGTGLPRVAIAYTDTVPPGQTLRLRPAFHSWIGLENGIQRAESTQDPSAPGPWQGAEGWPADAIAAIVQTEDMALWAAAGATLQRFDGTTWTGALSGLPAVHALAQDGHDLLIATEDGLRRMPLYPETGPLTATAEAALAGRKIFSLVRDAAGRWWFGTDEGALSMDSTRTVTPSALQGVEVYAVAQDATGIFHFGTALGLFEWQPGGDRWFWYEGPDFQPFENGKLPNADQPFLPPVRCVLRGSDGSLWLGTDQGIARYTAAGEQVLGFETVLEAFPDITAGAVLAIAEDPRGLLWFATASGLFRFDGRDWWQFRAGAWVQMGRADTLYPSGVPRGAWRFHRSAGQWQRFDGAWGAFTDAPRGTSEPAVRALAWTEAATAELGQWDGKQFSNPAAVPAGKLVMRVKPNEQRIAAGGIPALPRLPVGASTWRYLSMEPDSLTPPEPRPWWSQEGRLFPPPPDRATPGEGRYDVSAPPPSSNFDDALFSYNPAARVWFEWNSRRLLSVLVRLKKLSDTEALDPAIIDRVWQGIQQVRPAGVKIRLAVEEDIVRGQES